MPNVQVTTVALSDQGLMLSMMEGPRQRAAEKLQREQRELERLALQLQKQADVVKAAQADYDRYVHEMTKAVRPKSLYGTSVM